jgi:hypoxanthine phosphoribosyltransferase
MKEKNIQDGKYEFYTWDQFDKDCEKIAQWAKGRRFKSVYGIPRGGLAVALKISHLLDIPLVLSKEDITPETLVVGDIIDSGKTMRRLLNYAGEVKVATIYVNQEEGDFFIRRKTKWVVFPWETVKTSRYDKTAI